jgi:hypothetical protein
MEIGSVKYFGILALALLMAACASKNDSASTSLDISLLPMSVTQQDSYPGVESNLRSIRNYRLELRGHCQTGIMITHVIADSVLLPVTSVMVGDTRVNALTGYPISGENITVVITASRNFYSSDSGGPEMTPIKYEACESPLPKDHVGLNLKSADKVFTISAGEAKTLEPMFHP